MTLAWIDVETTGLDHTQDEILEIACAISDDEGHLLHLWHTPVEWTVRGKARLFANEEVRQMHTESGLIDALCGKGLIKPIPLHRALSTLQEFLAPCPEETRMAGYSVQFDQRFLLAADLGCLHALCHRILDVSSVELFAQQAGLIDDQWRYMWRDPNKPQHRALNDAVWAMDVYKQLLFLQREAA